jgi:hypothetical protein
VTGKSHDDDPLGGVELSRRELIRKIVVGSAFALPVVASFDMASLGVSSAYANTQNQPPYNPSITSANATTFTVGVAGSFTVVTPGDAPMTVSQTGALPNGVKFTAVDSGTDPNDDNDGTITGTPAAGTGGVYPITLTASNGTFYPAATQAFTLTVNQPPAFTSATSASLTTGTAATVAVTTSGHPTATITQAGTLPPGMSFTANAAAGTASISGTPTTPGSYVLTLTASNGVGTAATQTLTLTVHQPPAFTSSGSATFIASEASSVQITTSGQPEATISLAGTLPTGVSFVAQAATGNALLSGTPAASAAGTYALTLTASNGISPNATQAFVLTVAPPTENRSTKSPPNAFSVSGVKTGTTTEITFEVTVPGPGTITAIVTAPPGAGAASVAKKTTPKRVTVATTKVSVKQGGKVKLKTKFLAAGRRLARSKDHRHVELWLIVTYKPTGGKADSHTIKRLHLK